MNSPAIAEAMFTEDFAANAAKLPGARADWLAERRRSSFAEFAKQGVPHRRIEAWKYTDLRGVLEEGFAPAPRNADAAKAAHVFTDPFAAIPGPRIVLVNGYFERGLSKLEGLSDGVELVDLGALDEKSPGWVREGLGGRDGAFGAASLALMRGGIAIRVPAGIAAKEVLHLQFLNPERGTAAAQHVRILLVIEDHASLTLLESHCGAGDGHLFADIGMDVRVGAHADCHHVRLQRENGLTVHVASVNAQVEENANYRLFEIDLGARLARLDLDAALSGKNATVHAGGLALIGGEALSDITTHMDHRAPGSLSRQVVRQVLAGRARGVYQGKVSVGEGALGADSHQIAKALLLSRHAEADLKPELEILTDDVKCGHGATVGDIEADQLFYLRARGIPESEARALLIRAFVDDAVAELPRDDVRAAVWAEIDAVLTRLLEMP